MAFRDWIVEYRPGTQGSHVPPSPVPASPASHFEHLAEPLTAFSPSPHAMQLVAADALLKVFTAHFEHSSSPGEPINLPGMQGRHCFDRY